MNRPLRPKTTLAAAICLAAAATVGAAVAAPPAAIRPALDWISASSLRGHLSFLSSDLLEGRATPSKGQDLAAEYIAAQFRRAGLEPGGDDNGFFQVARWQLSERPADEFALTIATPGKPPITLSATQVSLATGGPTTALNLDARPIVKIAFGAADAIPDTPLTGKIVLTALPVAAPNANRFAQFQAQQAFAARVGALGAALIVAVDRASAPSGLGAGQLVDPESAGRPQRAGSGVPVLTVADARVAALADTLPNGATATLNLPAPRSRDVALRNVVGVLRGSDPALKDTCVLLSAHYDHLGVRAGGAPGEDTIYNGANDDGSGTVSVVEIAGALARLPRRPKRSIVFVTFFGEERGLLGSRYFAKHSNFPLEKIVAGLNLEQVGRTDDTEGPQVGRASLTGFDYSDVGKILADAGRETGIEIIKHPKNSDAYFGRSDNQALADAGIPAHTLCTAFEYPDYHGVGDHWEKVDYDNMAKIDRAAALAVWRIADSVTPPQWSADNPRAARYREARKGGVTK